MNKQSTIKKNNPVVFMLKSNIGIISVMFIIAIGLTLLTPKFMTVNNVISVLRQISNNVFLALGMTMGGASVHLHCDGCRIESSSL